MIKFVKTSCDARNIQLIISTTESLMKMQKDNFFSKFLFSVKKNKFAGFAKQEIKLVWPYSVTEMPKLHFFGINLDSQFFLFLGRIQKGL